MKYDINFYLKFILMILIPLLGIYHFFSIDISDSLSIVYLFFSVYIGKIMFENLKNFKLSKYDYLFSLILSLMHVYGTIIVRTISNDFSYRILVENAFINLIYIYSFSFIIANLLFKTRVELESILVKNEKKTNNSFVFYFIIFFIIYFFYSILLYPGLLSPDSFSQLGQALGKSTLSNHHPIVHTLVIKTIVNFGLLIKNATFGVALYSLFQLTTMSACFAYLVSFMDKELNNKYLRIISLIYFGGVPMFGFYSVTMWKDVLFGCFCLMLSIYLYKYIHNKNYMKDNIIFMLFVLLVSLFRNNGVYIVFLLFIILMITYKKRLKNNLKYVGIPLIIALVITGPIYNFFNIQKGNFAETVGIPLRQISGVVAYNKKLSISEINDIEKIVPIDVIKENYTYISIDSIKFNDSFNNFYLNNNKAGFIKLWVTLLLKHPLTYIDVYLKSTFGFWYANTEGYGAHIWGIDSSNEYDIKPQNESRFSKALKIYLKVESLPVIKYINRPATYLYIIIFLFYLCAINKNKDILVSSLIPILSWFTIMIASPVCYQVRYVFSLFTTFPFIMFLIFCNYKKEGD